MNIVKASASANVDGLTTRGTCYVGVITPHKVLYNFTGDDAIESDLLEWQDISKSCAEINLDANTVYFTECRVDYGASVIIGQLVSTDRLPHLTTTIMFPRNNAMMQTFLHVMDREGNLPNGWDILG